VILVERVSTSSITDCGCRSFILKILSAAIEAGASDVHIEPGADSVIIRYAIDGILQHACTFDLFMRQGVCAAVKVLGGLDLAQSTKPQCGRLEHDGCDVRVSSHPTIYGENLVLRILGCQTCPARDVIFENFMETVLKKASGIVLVTGPTGAGKTTTINELIGRMAAGGRNVMSLEDPVERRVDGVRQTSIESDDGFAIGLKSILRQNPDVIFVGEIRDSAVAELVFQAAATGRLVISTLHARTALHSFQRLTGLGVKLSDIRDNLVGVFAQRLLRKKCCSGCPLCISSGGYLGRILVAEWIEMCGPLVEMLDGRIGISDCKLRLEESGVWFMEDQLESLIGVGISDGDGARVLM
jgi:type II secretory ATPase GspE/PulE/Tfp pilus assembly ATPase PilB-like protein